MIDRFSIVFGTFFDDFELFWKLSVLKFLFKFFTIFFLELSQNLDQIFQSLV